MRKDPRPAWIHPQRLSAFEVPMRTTLFQAVVSTSFLFAIASPGSGQAVVAVIPDNGPNADSIPRLAQSANDTVKFYVKNLFPTLDAHFQMTCSRSGNVTTITSCLPANPIIAAGDSVQVTAIFSVGAAGTGRVQLTATYVPTGASATGGWDITIVNPTQVTPKDSLATVLASSSNRIVFAIKNNNASSKIYTLSKLCIGPPVAGCGALSKVIDTILANSSDTVSIGFTATSVADTGRIRVWAAAMGVPNDTGTVRVTVTNAMAAPVIDAANYNAGRALPRDECLTIALGEASAAECGDLRAIYQLPMFRVLDVERRPTLLYNSATAQPVIQVAVKVTVPNLTLLPDTIEAVLKVGGTVRARQRWIGQPWGVQAVPRYIRVRDTTTPIPSTSLINYTVEVTSSHKNVSSLMSSTTQQVLIVNRQSSPYGNGWWLAGLEQLFIVATDTLIWVGGDGSARVFARPFGSTGVWKATSIPYPETIQKTGSVYIRATPDSLRVTFDAAGRHISTKNRQGHLTSFAYDGSGRLQTITLPIVDASLVRSWTFTYGSSYYIVTDALGRPQTTIWETSGRVDSIIGVGAPKDSITFAYKAGTSWMNRRTDRLGTVRRFNIDTLGKVLGSGMGPNGPSTPQADSIVVTLAPAEAKGFSTSGSVDSVAFHTTYDGPRKPLPVVGGVADTAAFWVNRFGAPYRIVSALGDSTGLRRDSTSRPGLVTRFRTVSGQVVRATYDTLGRMRSLINPYSQMTRFEWENTWNQLTAIVPPLGDSTAFGIDPVNGNRIWQQDPRGTSARISFHYNSPWNQVTLIDGVGASSQSFAYDKLGDLWHASTQSGYTTAYTQDLIGRTVQITQQSDILGKAWQIHKIAYDVNRPGIAGDSTP
jgi:YD repeat-containing protein